MSKTVSANWVMFGIGKGEGNSKDLTDKGILVGYSKKFSSWCCSIYRLKNAIKAGDAWEADNVRSELYNLCFCTKESLNLFIEQLQLLQKMWNESETQGECEKFRGEDE